MTGVDKSVACCSSAVNLSFTDFSAKRGRKSVSHFAAFSSCTVSPTRMGLLPSPVRTGLLGALQEAAPGECREAGPGGKALCCSQVSLQKKAADLPRVPDAVRTCSVALLVSDRRTHWGFPVKNSM